MGRAPTPPLLQVENLSKRFGATQALSGVSLAIEPQEIRALVGRNGAGKSTLVSILTGMLEPDTGSLRFGSEAAPPPHAREQWQSKVACVYQHPKIIPALSCAENLFLGRPPGVKNWVSWKAMRREARSVLKDWGLDLDVDVPAGELKVGERQLLEIARALHRGSRILILDEPTARLEASEAARLFEHVRALKQIGVGILFISHYLEEIFDLCSSVTVLRDGRVTLDRQLGGLPRTDLIEAMVACADRPVVTAAPDTSSASIPAQPMSTRTRDALAARPAARQVRLEVTSLRCRPLFKEVSFKVHTGECLGVAGLAGSGKEALGEALAGLRAWDSGTVRLDGLKLSGGDVATHNRLGIGFVPEDRLSQGLVLEMSVADNAALPIPDQLGRAGFIDPRKLERFAQRMIRDLDIRTAGPKQPVSRLSGGNQQRVVLARALARDPRVLVLIHPTAGVDVASKAALFTVIGDAARCGTAVVLISDELEELDFCDRIVVIRAQRLTGEFAPPYSHQGLQAAMEGVGT